MKRFPTKEYQTPNVAKIKREAEGEDQEDLFGCCDKKPKKAHKGFVLVSACLLGIRCRYHGRRDYNAARRAYEEAEQRGLIIIPYCPEMEGGLQCPRPPARRKDGRLIADSEDVTENYKAGARKMVRLAGKIKPKEVWLLGCSPACDPKYGVAGKALAKAGFNCREYHRPFGC